MDTQPRRVPGDRASHTKAVLTAVLAVAFAIGAIVLRAMADPTTPDPTAVSAPAPLASDSPAGMSPDPRSLAPMAQLADCGGEQAAFYAFVIPHARDYLSYLPAMGRAPELETEDRSAFVVVYRSRYPGQVFHVVLPAGRTPAPTPTLAPLHHDVCVVVGGLPDRTVVYGDVSLEGFDPAGHATPP